MSKTFKLENFKRYIARILILSMIFSIFGSFNLKNVYAESGGQPTIEGQVKENVTTGSAITIDNSKIDEAIDDVKAYFEGFDGRYSNVYDYKIAMALRRTGTNTSDIAEKINIYGIQDVHSYARNIMTLIASNNDPKNYKEKNYVQRLLEEKFYEDDNSEYIAKAILALDMVGDEYDKEKAVKALISKANDEGNEMISFGVIEAGYYDDWEGWIEGGYSPNTATTALVLTAISKYRNMDGVNDTITKAKKYLKSFQSDNAFIKEKTSWSEDEDASTTAIVVEALIALGEDPLSDEWTKVNSEGNTVTMLDALLSCKDGQKFKNNPSGGSGNKEVSASVLLALTDLRQNNSVYNELKYIEVSKATRIEIQGEKNINLVEGDTISLAAKAYDDNDLLIKDADLKWESSDEKVAVVEEKTVKSLAAGTVTITVSLKDDNSISDSVNINVEKNTGLSKEQQEKVKNEIEFLKKHFTAYNSYEFLASPAANLAQIDKGHIQNNIFKYGKTNTAFLNAKTIIALIGAGINPRRYEIDGQVKNYVDILRASQVKEGQYKGQFILNQTMDADSAEYLAYSIIALDMAYAEYNKEDAVKALLEIVNGKNLEESNGYKQVGTEAGVLIALAHYKNIDGVQDTINKLINYLKTQQNEDGGFNLNGGYFVNSPIATGTVIQALIANGINPLCSTEWIKNDKTMLDSLLKAKYNGSDDKSSGFSKGDGKNGMDYQATYYAFAALVDVYNNESMFNKLKIDFEDAEKGQPKNIKMQDIQDKKLLVGSHLKLNAVVFDENENWIEDAEIEWNSSDESKVSIENGVVTAVSAGSVTITAKVKNTQIKDTIELLIEGKEVKEIEIESTSEKVKVGNKLKLNAKAKNGVGEVILGKEFKWSSSKKDIAVINENTGEVTAVSSGTVIITAKLKENEDIKETIELTIFNENKASVKVRVEGYANTLFNEEIEYPFNIETHPLDVLKEVVGENKVQYDSSMFLTSILDEEQKRGSSGWCYYVKFKDGNIIQPMVGVNDFEGMTDVNGESITDELVFYISAYSGTSIFTKIPIIRVEKDGIKVVNNEVGNEPIKGVEVKVGAEGTYETDEKGEVSFNLNKAGTYNVEISKDKDYPMIVRQHIVLKSEGSSTQELQDVIEELKVYYKNKEDLKAIEVMAYNSLMNDKNDYKTSFALNTSENVGAYAENIMGCLATGQDAKSYIDKLVNSQNEEGKFVIGENDADSVTALADSITALDMAKAEYNVEKAVKVLVGLANSGHYEDATTTAYALRALLKHKDIDGVDALISSSLAYLQEQQLENGGYDYYESGSSPYSTGPVVQALVRAKENISSEQWKKGTRTLVDSLLTCKIDGKGFEMIEGMGEEEEGATQFAFAALSDIYTRTSMYDDFGIIEELDNEAPVITTNLENKTVNSSELIFTVSANDNKDGDITPIVKLGEEVVTPQVNGSYKVALSEGKNTITIEAVDKVGNKAEKQICTITYIEISDEELREQVEKAIDSVSELLIQNGKIGDWQAIGIARASKSVPNSYFDGVKMEDLKVATDYERTILGVLAAGGDPTDIKDINLIEKLCEINLVNGTNIDIAYGLIALDAGEYNIPKKTSWTRKDLVKKLIDNKNNDGGWALFGEISDPDTTGMVMTALATYNNSQYPEVQEAIKRAVAWLSTVQEEDGSYTSKGDKNSNSCSQVVMGLCINGINPTGDEFTKNGVNVVEALLGFKSDNGGFGFTNTKYNLLATEQALYALDQYIYYLEDNGSIYNWGDRKPDQGDNKAPIIITSLEDKMINSEELIFTVEVNDKEDGDITPVVKLGKEVVAPKEGGSYKVTLSEGENIVTIEAEDTEGKKDIRTITIIYKKVISSDKKVRVRVEGDKSTLFNEEVEIGTAKNALELLTKAVGKENVTYTSYITAIKGLSGFGWMDYIVKNGEVIVPMVGVESQDITDGDEIVFYAINKTYSTLIPNIDITNEENKYTLTVTAEKTDWSTGAVSTVKVIDVDINIEGVGSYKTNANGQVIFELPKGTFEAEITKYSENGPDIVKQTISLENEKSKAISVENLTEQTEFKLGRSAKVIVKITNNTNKTQNITVVTALFTKQGKFLTYAAAQQQVDTLQSTKLIGMLKIPESGECEIRAMIVDDLENMNPLSNVIVIPVK
ncbi:Ig-like domain-containing protein [Clostridium aestuarii]|uniref:Ig-like domain-containing protein n=1 Tax=Clostridium aestuarii TaxID=338193 RepID=A0ABT4CWX1_9CLOT|nr:Ig-like domain-containing protein [Clostridium aestuarii]MCY6482842.1 Ig-like domain-containing protein [Clostridium aestuarii]